MLKTRNSKTLTHPMEHQIESQKVLQRQFTVDPDVNRPRPSDGGCDELVPESKNDLPGEVSSRVLYRRSKGV